MVKFITLLMCGRESFCIPCLHRLYSVSFPSILYINKEFPYMYVYTYFHIVLNNSLEIKIHFLCKEVWLKKWRGVPPPRYKKVQFKKKILHTCTCEIS